MSLLLTLNKKRKEVNQVCWLLCSLPAFYVMYCYLFNSMGTNPYEFLMNYSGHCSIILFIITYSIVPTRRWLTAYCAWRRRPYGKRLSDWNFMIYNRRMLGLNTFYFATLHLFIYLYLELDFDWTYFLEDWSRHFIILGWVSWSLLFLLAITSPKYFQKKLKQYWKKIHLSIHVISILLILHVYLEAAIPDTYFWIYMWIITVMSMHRILVTFLPYLVNERDTGEEVNR